MNRTIALFVFVALGSIAAAGPFRTRGSQCGPGGCPIPQPSRESPANDARDGWYQGWYQMREHPQVLALYRDGVHVGSWVRGENYWRDYDARRGVWGPKMAKSPVPLPEEAAAKLVMPPAAEEPVSQRDPHSDLKHEDNHGVDWSKINDHQATYNGRKISCDKAIELIGKQVPDDSNKFRLTVIGTEAEQKDALAAFALCESAIKDRVNTWAVTADHWSLKDQATGVTMFHTAGKPVVYLQAPDGKVLHRQDDGAGMVEAIRKGVKAYDAAKDPDLRKPGPKVDPKAPTPEPAQPMHPAVPACCLLGAAAVIIYLTRKKAEG